MPAANEIIHYLEMCSRERASLQRGMNFRLGREYSVILMSVRANAPYQDRLEEDGSTLIYEGHDAPRRVGSADPKLVDQPDRTPRGRPTENGRFWEAAHAFKAGTDAAHLVRVYEKIYQGIWSFNGTFQLLDAWREHDGKSLRLQIQARRIYRERFSGNIAIARVGATPDDPDSYQGRGLETRPREMCHLRRKG